MARNAPTVRRKLVLYSKPDCHLCDIAYELLLGLRREFQFDLEKVDVRQNPVWWDKYRDKIPVLAIDGRQILYAPIRVADVRRALNENEN
jgi:glutaredoxin